MKKRLLTPNRYHLCMQARFETAVFFLVGYAQVFAQMVVAAVLIMWALQVMALPFGGVHDWAAVLLHLVQSLTLLVFFPGQTLWTFRRIGPDGHLYTIVGREHPPP